MENIKQDDPEEIPKNEINEEKLDAEEKEEDKKEEDKKEEDKKKEDKREEDKKEEGKKEEDKKDKKKKKKDKEKKDKKEKKEKKEKTKKKEEPKKADKTNIIYSIDEQNKLCVDCGAENPTKVSINNGVIICEDCSKIHEDLGPSVSFLKNINDDYDEYLISFIVMGSNTKFKRFLTKEQVDTSLPVKKKYQTAALHYYRKNLKAKVEGKDEIKIDFEDPNKIIYESDDNYPEFNKKYVIKNQVLRKGNVINQNKFSFMYIFNKVFSKNKKKRGRSFDKKKKINKNEINNDIDMNKTMPPEFPEDKKEDNILESNRPFQEDKKVEKKKKEDNKEKIEEDDEDIIKKANTEIKDKEV